MKYARRVAWCLVVGLTFLLIVGCTMVIAPAIPTPPAAQELPYTVYFTHYEMLGDANSPSGVSYHSSGQPFAKAPDGSKVILSGQGGWDPSSQRVAGGG